MRTEQEMLELIVDTAKADDRVRAVIMNGSRANPNVSRDPFQDFDIVYIVSDVESFKQDPEWITRFGETMIVQTPEDMEDPPPTGDGTFSYLMQFTDGNRIDLGLYPVRKLGEMERDSLSLLLLDKDGIIEPFPPASESDYLPRPPTAKAFSDCCNEFWWACPYIAKGLWRREIVYAKYMLDTVAREQLTKLLIWHIGLETDFSANPGMQGKHFKMYLGPELWTRLESTYADADLENTWVALFVMSDLFRDVGVDIARRLRFEYPILDDARVTKHLQHVRHLPRDAKEVY